MSPVLRFERQLSVLDASITTLELQRSALEDSPANKESIKTIGFAAKALKTAHGDLDIREVRGFCVYCALCSS